MRTLAFDAMVFAREVHAGHVRKYTGAPYFDHLAEVAGITASVAGQYGLLAEEMIATAFLHDCVEDRGVTLAEIDARFGNLVAIGVSGLSDLESGNRAERKKLARDRLDLCSGWIQTIKVADLISNTASIVQHDHKFAVVYLSEARLLLDVLGKADPRLLAMARLQIGGAA